MRTFVLGDVHGACKALKQCCKRAGFDHDQDRLIFLGDVADGWPEVPECIEEFKKIRNLVMLRGNHDLWFLNWLETGETGDIWLFQGGLITIRAYEGNEFLKKDHLSFMKKTRPYYIFQDNLLFVHAGFTIGGNVENTRNPEIDYYWDRELFYHSFKGPVLPDLYKEIYIGHTPTYSFSGKPVKNHNVWLMDQGAGWEGFLSMMDIESKEIYQSDRVTQLYPDDPGRASLMKMM